MFDRLVGCMGEVLHVDRTTEFEKEEKLPKWL
jgi:hypothetical protein